MEIDYLCLLNSKKHFKRSNVNVCVDIIICQKASSFCKDLSNSEVCYLKFYISFSLLSKILYIETDGSREWASDICLSLTGICK